MKDLINEKKIPNLIILIGIPGSGKSRWAKERTDYYRVCPDDIRKQYSDSYDSSLNSRVWDQAKGMIIASLELGIDVLLDATNVTTTYRRNLYKNLPDHKRHARIFDISPETSIERIRIDIKNKVDRSDVPSETVYRYYGEMLYSMTVLQEENFVSIEEINQDFGGPFSSFSFINNKIA